MKKIHPANSQPDPSFRPWLRIAVPLILLQWVVFKLIYPHAGFFSDSYTYIQAAMQRDMVSIRQVGYSWFLLLIHSLSASDTFLVSVQYLLLQSAGLYLFYSLMCFYRPPGVISYTLFFFLLLNPVNLYISNEVSSDTLFTALSLFWITELLWLVQRPGWKRMLRQLILLTIIFFVRYNALYYPFVAAIAFLFSRKGGWFRWMGVMAGFLVVGIGVLLTITWTKRETGVSIFSGFSGWQIGNNALCIYPHVQVDTADLPTPECRELNRVVAGFFAAPPAAFRPADPSQPLAVEPGAVDTWFMWETPSPLKSYMHLRQQREHTDYFTAWNRAAVVFKEYGGWLMKHHPFLFSRYYLFPSAKTFFYPRMEILERYNEGNSVVEEIAKDWFHYRTLRVGINYPAVQNRILMPVRWLYLVLNVVAVSAFFIFLLFPKARRCMLNRMQVLPRNFLLVMAYLVFNAGFSIFATGSVFRYQLAPLTILFCFIILFSFRLAKPRLRWNP